MKKKLTIIQPHEQHGKNIRAGAKLLRVAAYCRVSTVFEQQENSYEAQIAYYTEKTENNPNWILAEIYADDGRSATNTKKRNDFNAMIEDCMAGKIDLVITKSVSRFARNTVDSLLFIRMLKEKNIGIIFEKEGINTLESTGELLITVLSSQAQEESRNISENTRWGIVRQFEKGIFHINHKKFMGYTVDENGQLIIVPEEAEIVRIIFLLFIEGQSYSQICRILEDTGIKTVTGNTKWARCVIEKMLSNEKYMGDALLQKTYTIDFLTKKRVINKGIVSQYYIKGNHEAIIPEDLFLNVQKEKARRASMLYGEDTVRKQYSGKYALSNVLVCGECGYPYRRVTRSKAGKVKIVWRCLNRLKNGIRDCKNSPSITEDVLHNMVADAINKNATAKAINELFLPACQYDDRLVRLLIERIEVKQNGSLEVWFKYND